MHEQTDDAWKARLMSQDAELLSPRYGEHRMQLELKLSRLARWERIVHWVTAVALILAVVLLPVVASKMFGPADPFEKGANILSVSLGALQILSTATFWIGLAMYYSRITPQIRKLEDSVRDNAVRELLAEVRQLREQVTKLETRIS